MILIAAYEGWQAFSRGAQRSLPKEKTSDIPPLPQSGEWVALCDRANRIVEEIISGLPPNIAAEARLVPCRFRERAEEDTPGYRILGHYHNFIPGHKSDYKGPIFLYLKSIEESCTERNVDFEAEVKFTYLHELGHHFGWDEVDLVRHGLPSGRPPDK